MEKTNFYKVLEIEDFSSISEVKKAFRRLALIYHPDINNTADTGEKFKLLVKAYETLRNTNTKEKYDELLKNGFNVSELFNFTSNKESEYERRRNQYFRMRKEKDEFEEIENIAAYEKSLRNFPYVYRIALIILVQLSGIMLILDDWYKKGSFIFLGSILFFLTSIIFWNEIFKHFWHLNIRMPEENRKQPYEKNAYRNFIKLFSGGILIIVLLINAKKAWHIHYFGTLTVAENDYKHMLLIYSYNNKIYTQQYFSLPDSIKTKNEILIKISSKEPEIWDIPD